MDGNYDERFIGGYSGPVSLDRFVSRIGGASNAEKTRAELLTFLKRLAVNAGSLLVIQSTVVKTPKDDDSICHFPPRRGTSRTMYKAALLGDAEPTYYEHGISVGLILPVVSHAHPGNPLEWRLEDGDFRLSDVDYVLDGRELKFDLAPNKNFAAEIRRGKLYVGYLEVTSFLAGAIGKRKDAAPQAYDALKTMLERRQPSVDLLQAVYGK